jgi:DNA-binding FrmR family transcriptional regulator
MIDGTLRDSILARLRRIEGQIRGIGDMVEDNRYCIDILTQTRAVSAALRKVEDLVMHNHLNTCVADAMRNSNPEQQKQKIDEIMNVFSALRRHG